MRRPFAVSIVLLISLLGVAAIAQQGPPPIGSGGSTVSGTSPIVVTGSVISCPTCGTSSGTVTSVSGTANQVDVATGTSTPVISLDSAITFPGTFTQGHLATFSSAGAASTPSVTFTGTPFTSGTGTTNFPNVYLNYGNAPTTFSTGGVLFGINGPSGFLGNMLEFHLNGASSVLSISQTGAITTTSTVSATGVIQASKFQSSTNCSASGTAANPSVVTCSAASMGAFACATAASTGTCQVNTTAVTTNSDILITPTASAGTRLSVTCNTTVDVPTAPRIASIANGASFTINLGTVATNPTCYFYTITN